MYTEYKTIFMEKKVVCSLYTMEPCVPGLSLFRVSHTRLRGPLSLSPLATDPATSPPPRERECGGLSQPLVTDPAASRPPGKGRKCIVSLFDGAEAARPDLRYTPFSLTKLRRGRAYATCSQIPPAAAHLVTSRRPPGIPSGLAPLPVFPRRCMWIFHSSLPKT